MRKSKHIDKDADENYFPIRPFQLKVILACGIIISLIGVYLLIEGEVMTGKAFSNGRVGPAAGTPIILNGETLTIIGLLICVFPTYQLIKQKSRTKNVG